MVIDATAAQDDLPARTESLAELTADPAFEAEIREILDQQFRDPVTVGTFTELMSRLELYFDDPDLALTLLSALGTTPEEDPELADALDDVDDPSARERLVRMLRHCRSRHGPAVAETLLMFNEDPEDWMTVGVEPAYVLSKDSWILEFIVTKYSREEVSFSSSPTSVVNLVQFMLGAINALPPTEVDEQLIQAEALEGLDFAYEAFCDRFVPAPTD